MKIFYSWQSDIGRNRNFIDKCLKAALTQTTSFEMETATRDSVGSPDIASTILAKIRSSNLFLADVSIINPEDVDSRKCPNPNVMYELGYAVRELGEDNIILIANRETTDTSKLPFDIRNRRMIIDDFSDKDSTGRVTSAIIKAMENYDPDSKEENSPSASLASKKIEWASNYSGHGAAFRTRINIDNYGGKADYITTAKLVAQDAMGDPWESKIFTFAGMEQNKPFSIEPNKMTDATLFLSESSLVGTMRPDLDIDTVRLELTFRSGKKIDLNYKPGNITNA
ncbi:MAG: hypothetical protein ACUZ77_10045 [Candidatus Brocadiales bacterium]